MQGVGFSDAVELGEDVVVCWAPVIVGAPYSVGTEGQSGEEAEGEAACTAQVGLGGDVYGALPGDGLNEVLDGVFGTVIHNDDPLHRVGLACYLLQRGAQQFNALVGDNYGGRGTGSAQGGSHAFHSATLAEAYRLWTWS